MLTIIEQALKEIYQGSIILRWDGKTHTLIKGDGSIGDVMTTLVDGQFYRDARDRITTLVEYVRATEAYHAAYFGTKNEYPVSAEEIKKAWGRMQEVRKKLGLYE